MLAVGVPAKVAGPASRSVPRARQVTLARRILEELHETLVLRGSAVEPLTDAEGIRVEGAGRVLFLESVAGGEIEPGAGETVVLTLGVAGEAPAGCVVLDLLAHRAYGETGGVLCNSVREFCRKRGIRFTPGPWRYSGGLV